MVEDLAPDLDAALDCLVGVVEYVTHEHEVLVDALLISLSTLNKRRALLAQSQGATAHTLLQFQLFNRLFRVLRLTFIFFLFLMSVNYFGILLKNF